MSSSQGNPSSRSSHASDPMICIVIPAKNEEATIAQVIHDIRKSLAGTRFDHPSIVVVNDSVDQTSDIAAAEGATVLEGGHVGLGHAMFRGLRWAGESTCTYVVSLDGDGQASPSEIPRFLDELEHDKADLVLGSRFLNRGSVKYNYPWLNRCGVRLLTWLLWFRSGQRFTDSHGGIRAMRRQVVAELSLTGTHTYVQETILDALQKGFRVVEIPSDWMPRTHGSSRVVSSIPRYAAHTLPVLLVKSGKHVTTIAIMGSLFVISGVVFFFIVLIQEQFSIPELFARIPALLLIALLVSVGTQMFFFGLMLELLRQIDQKVGHIRWPSKRESE